MDDDTLRRGKPTCHVAFGEATALLAGDALQALAFDALAGGRLPDGAGACALLAEAAGVHGMAGGQAIDLDSVGRDARAVPARNDAPDEDRRADPCRGAPRRRLRPAARRRRGRGARCLCGRRGPRLPGRRRRARRRRLGGDAGQDRRQGRRAGQADLRVAAWVSPPPRSTRRSCASEAQAALAPFGRSARRLAELADWIVLRTH